jgi:hypothetical protein
MNGTRNTTVIPQNSADGDAHSCFASFLGIKNNAQAYESESWRCMQVDDIC